MNLQDYATKIEALGRLEAGLPATDQYGQRLFETDAQESLMDLRELSRDIRSTAWSGPYQAWARELADRADAEATRIATENGLMGGSPLPRKGSVAPPR